MAPGIARFVPSSGIEHLAGRCEVHLERALRATSKSTRPGDALVPCQGPGASFLRRPSRRPGSDDRLQMRLAHDDADVTFVPVKRPASPSFAIDITVGDVTVRVPDGVAPERVARVVVSVARDLAC